MLVPALEQPQWEPELLPSLPGCIREGNGIPLQCSCLENPRDGGAWWAEPGRAPPRHAHGDLTSLAPHERLPEILVVPRASLGFSFHPDLDCLMLPSYLPCLALAFLLLPTV